MKRKVVDILRMQRTYNGGKTWKDIDVDFTFIDGASIATKLPIPELYGHFAMCTDSEIEYRKCKSVEELYYEDIIVCDSDNEVRLGTKSSVKIESTTPIKAIFWVAENATSSKKRNFSNYTTSSESLYEGWDPIKTNTLKYGVFSRFKDLESDHFGDLIAERHLSSYPYETGYHAHSIAHSPPDILPELGLTLSDANHKMTFKLDSGNPYDEDVNLGQREDLIEEKKEDDDEDDEDEDKEIFKKKDTLSKDVFIIKIRLLVMRKITITKNEDNKTYRFDVDKTSE
jgi:hypothetical protein